MGIKKSYGTEEGGYVESGNWNIAESFSIKKVMQPLIDFSDYAKIAEFGCMDLQEEFYIQQNVKIEARIKALKRMCHALLELTSCEFAIKRMDKGKLPEYKNIINNIVLPYISNCHSVTTRHINGKMQNLMTIDENSFDYIYRTLWKLHDDIEHVLNSSSLIYSTLDLETADELKERLTNRIINEG